MADPIAITVQLPEPAGFDHQALVACEFVLDQLSVHLTSPYDESPADFKRRVVAWLSEKYLGKTSSGSTYSLDDMVRRPCSRPGCYQLGVFPCADMTCPKRGR